ncbi:MAG: AAA family ATPase [Dysgonamonadaceae bacterium]|jgi:predicted AAA+ superfamily ATPase|nr:AAA family ATPase [Dysgonamonadaceae bacterium]
MDKMYLKRNIDNDLLEWKDAERRKPILLRGARQVGKSSTVRELAKQFDSFVEVNFERDDQKYNLKAIFERGFDPKRICDELSFAYQTPIVAGRTLLFFDEIQACIPAIPSLRYFYEEYPGLHVIAAGSLLEFALQELPSFGVGRIRSMFLYPFSFDEYLRAMGAHLLADALQKSSPENPFSPPVHHTCLNHLIRFILIGGMPEVVAKNAGGGTLIECQQVLDDLMFSLYDDFSKYKERVPSSRLREVFASMIRQTGGKFTYSHASQHANRLQIKEAVELLELAGIIYSVTHTSANGLPLAAEMNTKFRKYLPLDTGIYQRFLRLDLSQLLTAESLEQVNKGALAELFVGLELLKSAPSNSPVQLHYWQREKAGSNAEVDYVVQCNADIVPVEVKSGTKGSMQSMFQFLSEKEYTYGIRCSMENFGIYQNVKVYPLYAASRIGK